MASDSNQVQTLGVQRDSETPLPQKPSFLFLLSPSIGMVTIIGLAIGDCNGIIHN